MTASCQMCGAMLAPSRSNRPRKFCSERCRKRQYDLTCVDCGGRVDGTGPGRRQLPPRCLTCTRVRRTAQRRWTPQTIVAAIQRWASEHGDVPPMAKDWVSAALGRPEYAPPTSVVLSECGSWNEALRAAGFTPHRRHVNWTRESIIAAIRAWAAEHGEPPTCDAWHVATDSWPVAASLRQHFGSFNAAIRAAGFEPRPSGFRQAVAA